jgi:hypothetical protein
MTVRVYRSTDASAPVLTGQVGSLTALLDAVLVNGYGALSAAGWTIAQTTTNKRGYKQNTSGSNNTAGMVLYVDDTGPGAAAAREARACGFETLTAITPTGTGQFPAAAQSAIGVGTLVIRKSSTADATARAWTIIANGQTIYLIIETGDKASPALGAMVFVFGDIKSYRANDQYAVGIIGRVLENSGGSDRESFAMMGPSNSMTLNSKFMGHFMARSWTGIGGSVQVGKQWDWGKLGNLGPLCGWNSDAQLAFGGSTALLPGRNATASQWPGPNGADGGLFVSPVYTFHSWAMRGYWPGLWVPMHDRPLVHNDVVTVSSGNLNGKTLLCQQILVYLTGDDYGCVFFETSDTWS